MIDQSSENSTANSEINSQNTSLYNRLVHYTLTNKSTNETIDRVGAFNDLFVANLKVGSLDVSNINNELIKNLELRIKNLELSTGSAVLSSSISALLTNEQISSVYTESSTRSAVLSSLTVTGRTLLNDLGITGTITNGLLSIDGLNSTINSLTDIKFKTPGGQITIDKDGNMTVLNTISAKKYNVDVTDSASSSIGSGLLSAGTTSITITISAVTDGSKIFITPVSDTDKPLMVKNKLLGKSFDVTILAPYISDIHFDWFIIN